MNNGNGQYNYQDDGDYEPPTEPEYVVAIHTQTTMCETLSGEHMPYMQMELYLADGEFGGSFLFNSVLAIGMLDAIAGTLKRVFGVSQTDGTMQLGWDVVPDFDQLPPPPSDPTGETQ